MLTVNLGLVDLLMIRSQYRYVSECSNILKSLRSHMWNSMFQTNWIENVISQWLLKMRPNEKILNTSLEMEPK